MKHFEIVKEYRYPGGSVYVLYNKQKDFYRKKCLHFLKSYDIVDA